MKAGLAPMLQTIFHKISSAAVTVSMIIGTPNSTSLVQVCMIFACKCSISPVGMRCMYSPWLYCHPVRTFEGKFFATFSCDSKASRLIPIFKASMIAARISLYTQILFRFVSLQSFRVMSKHDPFHI